MLAIVAAGMLGGSYYWNDQLMFGLSLPKGYAYCERQTEDAPDRGMLVLMGKGSSCANLYQSGLADYEYVKKEQAPSLYVIAEYNTPEEFEDVWALAKSRCSRTDGKAGAVKVFGRKINGCQMVFCKGGEWGETLRGFVQLGVSRAKDGTPVNVEIGLRYTYEAHAAEYWRSLNSFSEVPPKFARAGCLQCHTSAQLAGTRRQCVRHPH